MIQTFQFTSPGPRSSNQDYVVVEDIPGKGLFASVADGVGGKNGGEIASAAASNAVVAVLKERVSELSDCIKLAHSEVMRIASGNVELKGMATTMTCVLIDGMRLAGAHAGDCRVCILRGNGIRQLTEDHTESGRMIRAGSMSPTEAHTHPFRNLLYSALGGVKELIVQTFAFELLPRDRVLLMSDGVHTAVTKLMIRDCSLAFPGFDSFCQSLVTIIEESKPTDNFSVIVLEVGGQ